MTSVRWTTAALDDLEQILSYMAERNPQGAATVAERVAKAVERISTFPRANRRDDETGTYECVVRGLPLLLINEIITAKDEAECVDLVAVFHTSREPAEKPGRRGRSERRSPLTRTTAHQLIPHLPHCNRPPARLHLPNHATFRQPDLLHEPLRPAAAVAGRGDGRHARRRPLYGVLRRAGGLSAGRRRSRSCSSMCRRRGSA